MGDALVWKKIELRAYPGVETCADCWAKGVMHTRLPHTSPELTEGEEVRDKRQLRCGDSEVGEGLC